MNNTSYFYATYRCKRISTSGIDILYDDAVWKGTFSDFVVCLKDGLVNKPGYREECVIIFCKEITKEEFEKLERVVEELE